MRFILGVLLAFSYISTSLCEIKATAFLFRNTEITPKWIYKDFGANTLKFSKANAKGEVTMRGIRQARIFGMLMVIRYESLFQNLSMHDPAHSPVQHMTSPKKYCVETTTPFLETFNMKRLFGNNFKGIVITHVDTGHILMAEPSNVCPNYNEEMVDRKQDASCDPDRWLRNDYFQRMKNHVTDGFQNFEDVIRTSQMIQAVAAIDPNTPFFITNGLLKDFGNFYSAYMRSLHANAYMIKIRAGLLITRIVDNFKAIVQRDETAARVLTFSGEDHNLFSLAYALNVQRLIPRFPKYLDTIAVELHQEGRGREHTVKVFYVTPHEKDGSLSRELIMTMCPPPCRFENFKMRMRRFQVEESDYKELCNSPDAREEESVGDVECYLS